MHAPRIYVGLEWDNPAAPTLMFLSILERVMIKGKLRQQALGSSRRVQQRICLFLVTFYPKTNKADGKL
jgi:hypothetical protein